MIVENNYNANGSNPPPAPQPNIFALPPGATTSPHSRSSLTHNARRTSIPNIPAVFVGEGEVQGEESMDLETDSEASDSDDDLQAVKHHISIIGDDADAEGEEDMDVTQVVYGGIVRRASMAADTSITSETSGIEADGDEEKTMDFTIAIGGLLPHSPPVGAVSDRLSLGYSVPMSPDSAGRRLIPGVLMEGEADMELELDETVALGGIVGADESLSSGGEDTVGTAPREKTMTFSYGDVRAPQPTDDGGIAGGGIQATALPTNTRPMSGTPSFARSTMSSAQKEKRNVFAPSPSPFKSTPRKSGMETAGEVAKRLSFGSTASSGGKKRAREDDVDENGSAKKGRSGPAEEVFGLSTDQVFSAPVPAPRRSLGTPKRSAKSPAKSPALRRMMGEVVEPSSEEPEWDQPPTISLAQFLDMTGVQFMEGLPGLNRRRSSVARGVLGQSYAGGGEFVWCLTRGRAEMSGRSRIRITRVCRRTRSERVPQYVYLGRSSPLARPI